MMPMCVCSYNILNFIFQYESNLSDFMYIYIDLVLVLAFAFVSKSVIFA